MKLIAVFFLVVLLLGSMFPVDLVVSSIAPNALDQTSEQDDSFDYTISTHETDPRELIGSDTGFGPTTDQRMNVSWRDNPPELEQMARSGLASSNPPDDSMEQNIRGNKLG